MLQGAVWFVSVKGKFQPCSVSETEQKFEGNNKVADTVCICFLVVRVSYSPVKVCMLTAVKSEISFVV